MRIIFICILFSCPFYVNAQIMSLSQSVEDIYLDNPAGYGQVEGVEVGVLNKSKFLGANGTARTSAFVFNSPFSNIPFVGKTNDDILDLDNHYMQNKVGIGFKLINAGISVHQLNQITVYYSYRIPVSFQKDSFSFDYVDQPTFSKFNISFGLSASLVHSKSDYSSLYYDETRSGVDPVIQESSQAFIYPNFGFGFKIDNPKFALGLSIPSIFDTNQNLNLMNIIASTRFLVPVNYDITAYPAMRFAFTEFAPMFHVGSQFFWLKKFGVGFMFLYRTNIQMSFHYLGLNGKLRVNYYSSIVNFNSDITSSILPVHEISVFYNLKND